MRRPMRPRIQKKSEEQLAARGFRAKRKKIAKRTARRTGKDVQWTAGRLVFSDTGRLANGHPVPKAA